ncbi:hypothetical protein [Chryseobacterium sp. sg2396]|uniref:hypothetical protein n=1 Tax=Chryseobacterium sp. sg2396 TaxID=3276280 RepID=UPI0025FD9F4D|nr:hypothetical protein [uncultured Chryseobacterium sp.]
MNPEELKNFCAEIKLNVIKEILQIDCESFKDIGNKHIEMNLELTPDQLRCMSNGAEEIFSENSIPQILEDFIINTKSFKSVNFSFDNIHFIFIDNVSLNRFLKDINGSDISVRSISQKYMHYYIILNCNEDNLYEFVPTNYNAYLVDDNSELREINISTSFGDVRKEFLEGIGELIRKKSTLNGITEYITFPLKVVETFIKEQYETIDIRVKLIRIKKDCILQGINSNVNDVLRDPKKQKKLSMAFQKNNSNFYDIGNMQP